MSEGEGDAIRDAIRKLAQRYVEQMRQTYNVALEFDRQGVELLESYIERMRAFFLEDTDRVDRAANTMGAFLGECLVSHYGGRWVNNEERDEWGVEMPGKIVAFPVTKVHKRITDGAGDNVLSLFDAVALMRKRAEGASER
jgi:hypothetical protein